MYNISGQGGRGGEKEEEHWRVGREGGNWSRERGRREGWKERRERLGGRGGATEVLKIAAEKLVSCPHTTPALHGKRSGDY